MILTLPRESMLYPPGYGDPYLLYDFGLNGLGDCVTDGTCGSTDQITPDQLAQELAMSTDTTPTASGSSLGVDLQTAINAANAATRALQIAEGPSLVPGTTAIYNPATGQITTALGTNLSAAAAPLSTVSSTLPLIAGLGLAVILIMVMKR